MWPREIRLPLVTVMVVRQRVDMCMRTARGCSSTRGMSMASAQSPKTYCARGVALVCDSLVCALLDGARHLAVDRCLGLPIPRPAAPLVRARAHLHFWWYLLIIRCVRQLFSWLQPFSWELEWSTCCSWGGRSAHGAVLACKKLQRTALKMAMSGTARRARARRVTSLLVNWPCWQALATQAGGRSR